MNHSSSTIKKYYPALIGAALLAGSLFQFSRPVFSAGTAAGQIIRNTATGTYNDTEGNSYKIDSNTVDVTVAKVAGISNMPTGFTDETTTNTSVLNGDTVSFEFTVTNIGNDVSDIFIPARQSLSTQGLQANSLNLEVKGINNGNNDSSDPTATNYDGNAANFIALADQDNPVRIKNVPVNGQVIVKVTGTVGATASGAAVRVQLGNTGNNADINSPQPGTQNQLDADDGGANNDDVRTITTDGTDNPVDGQKEASAVRQVFLGSTPLALARIEKTAGEPTIDSNDIATIPYNLELEVLGNAPNPNFTPGNLKGRDLVITDNTNLNNSQSLILISDSLPVGSELKAFPSQQTIDGRVWIPVYKDNQTTTAATQQWLTQPPTDLSTVKRIGWIYDTEDTSQTTSGAIPPGTTVSGFEFEVTVDTSDGIRVANIAQVFGATEDSDNDNTNDDKIFDESGDQDASNFSGGERLTETDPQSTGVANPLVHGIDEANLNTAVDSPGGEDNVIDFGAPGILTNGPQGKPGAVGNIFVPGTTDNNHDFQNKGISEFNGASGNVARQHGENNTLNPEPVIFENTLRYPGGDSISNVLLQPIPPSIKDLDGPSQNLDDRLPVDTEVTINLGSRQAIYTYKVDPNDPNEKIFELNGNTGSNPSQPIVIDSLAGGATLNYQVTVDLPPGTKLSTDDLANDDDTPIGGYPVPIIAFANEDNTGDPSSAANNNFNVTVNQVYTGFIKITKDVKVFPPNSTDARADTENPRPGDTLRYIVEYRNISEPQAGSGDNLVLNGVSVEIAENGTENNNNWALDNNNDGDLDTVHKPGSASDSGDGQIFYLTGDNAATNSGTSDPGDDVRGYRDTISEVAPTADPFQFIFERVVDDFDGLAEDIDSQPATP